MDLDRARGLTKREAAAVEAVKALYATLERPPSMKELTPALGVGTSQAHDLVKGAARAGALTIVRQRGYRTQIRLNNPLQEFSTALIKIELATRNSAAAFDQVGAALVSVGAAARQVARSGKEPEDSVRNLAA